jgi:hypothetical protein
MPTNIRLKENELDGLEKASLVLNKALIDRGIQPITITKMVHAFSEKGIEDTLNNADMISSHYSQK